MQLSEIKQKVVFDQLHVYSKQVLESMSLADLIAPTKVHIRTLASIVMPDSSVEFKQKMQAPPQELID